MANEELLEKLDNLLKKREAKKEGVAIIFHYMMEKS